MPKKITDFQRMQLYLWGVEHEQLQKRIPQVKGIEQLRLIEEWEQLSEKIQKLDPAFSNPRKKRSFAGEVVSGAAFGLGSGISQRLLTGVTNPKMESFSTALKRNIKQHGFKGAMAQTWKEVKARKVARLPRRKKAARISRTVKTRSKRKNPIQREFYVVEFPSGQTSQTFSTKQAAIKFLNRFGGVGVVRKMTPYSKSKNPRKKRIRRKNPIAIYNPGKQTLLYGKAFIPEIRGVKTNGSHKGQRFRHKFTNEVAIYGNPDGSLTVKGLKGVKLWDYQQNIEQ